MVFVFMLILGFFLGSIPFGLLIGKYMLGIDVRSQGSGNIGTTNLVRLGGKLPGILTFLLDFAKGAIAMLIAQSWLVDGEGQVLVTQWSCIGVAAVCGHVFSIFLQFRGGKGIATLFGVLTVLKFPIGLLAALVWIGIFLAKRISSLAALSVLGVLPLLFLVIPWILGESVLIPQVLLYTGLSALLTYRHRENILRLLRGEETKLKAAEEES
ncbi:MAG: glycerol-3-phosphate 1-O-acyltransferase PlsY [SAR324 cluster bacterium]|nr:glycerol-3-phosphate 1-O-acyltransferase PlsY [SAR324 cluster bacterium]